MNIDLITKLAKLANENPNENEANLAARKVCSLIKAGEYKFNNSNTNTQTRPQAQRAQPWDDLKSDKYYSSDFSWFYDDIRKSKSNPNIYDQEKYKPTPEQDRYYNKYHSSDSPYTENKKEDKPKRPLKCKTCRQEIMTAFMGLEIMFECYKCQWSGYEEKKEKE